MAGVHHITDPIHIIVLPPGVIQAHGDTAVPAMQQDIITDTITAITTGATMAEVITIPDQAAEVRFTGNMPQEAHPMALPAGPPQATVVQVQTLILLTVPEALLLPAGLPKLTGHVPRPLQRLLPVQALPVPAARDKAIIFATRMIR